MRQYFRTLQRRLPAALWCGILCLPLAPALAESCATQAQMKLADRDALASRARQLGAWSLSGNSGEVKNASVPDLQGSFSGVAEAIASLKPAAAATLTIASMYLFENTSARSGVEGAEQFYCGENTPERVTLTLSGLQAGRYALVLMHATGVADPRRLTLVLQDTTAPAPATPVSWKLAGFLNRPMVYGGHDGLWFWTEARKYQKNHELWNASIFYEVARQLSLPAGFISSANAEKLEEEQRSALPADWPSPARPLQLTVAGKPVEVASVNPAFDGTNFYISLDTVASAPAAAPLPSVSSAGTANVPPAAPPLPAGMPPAGLGTPAEAVAAALIARVPELKSAFHGVYIHAQNDAVTAVVTMKSL